MSAPHTNGSAQAARKVPARKKKARVDHGVIDAPSGEKISYVQWMRDPIQIRHRMRDGWSIGQSEPCHHNRYALLMVAPEGWAP